LEHENETKLALERKSLKNGSKTKDDMFSNRYFVV
jgi:hypothetical protein